MYNDNTPIQMLAFVPSGLRWARSPKLGIVELFTDAGHVGFGKSGADLAGVSQEMADLLSRKDARLYVWHFGGTV